MNTSGSNTSVIIEEEGYETNQKKWKEQLDSMNDSAEQFLMYARFLIEGTGNSGYSNYFGDMLHPIITELYETMEELIQGKLEELYEESDAVWKAYLEAVKEKDNYYKDSEFSTNRAAR